MELIQRRDPDLERENQAKKDLPAPNLLLQQNHEPNHELDREQDLELLVPPPHSLLSQSLLMDDALR
jgi:hypothetical protein